MADLPIRVKYINHEKITHMLKWPFEHGTLLCNFRLQYRLIWCGRTLELRDNFRVIIICTTSIEGEVIRFGITILLLPVTFSLDWMWCRC